MLCATISAYFRGIQSIREIIYSLVVTDGRAAEGSRHMRTDDLLGILAPISAKVDEKRLPELVDLFQELARRLFLRTPSHSVS